MEPFKEPQVVGTWTLRVRGLWSRWVAFDKWGFPKIGGTLFWGPYNEDATV